MSADASDSLRKKTLRWSDVRQLRGVAADERGVGARDLGPAALPPVHEPLLAQQAVRGDHGSAPDAQLPRQRPLGR